MRNFLLLLFLFYTQVSFSDFGPVNRSVMVDGVGTLQGPLDKYYINVKNRHAGSGTDGTVVILDVSNDDGYSVTFGQAAGDVPHCVLDQTCASGAVCRCQTYGLKTNVQFDSTENSTTAGDWVYLDETAGQNSLGTVQAADEWTTLNINDIQVGVAYDTDTASGDKEVFIRLRK
mgnify:CR=1 FL=1